MKLSSDNPRQIWLLSEGLALGLSHFNAIHKTAITLAPLKLVMYTLLVPQMRQTLSLFWIVYFRTCEKGVLRELEPWFNHISCLLKTLLKLMLFWSRRTSGSFPPFNKPAMSLFLARFFRFWGSWPFFWFPLSPLNSANNN